MKKIFFTGVSLEIEERAKRRKRKGRTGGRKALKQPKAGRRPAKGGKGSKGCGTGAGGFAAGNQCALEDGVPQPLKQVNVKKTRIKAKQLAVKEQAAIKSAARKAAVKRVVKKMRDNGKKIKIKIASGKLKVTGTGQNVAEAIKLMKADKDLKIVGTPKSIKQQLEEMKKRREAMRDTSPKRAGENELEYQKRKNKPEWDDFERNTAATDKKFGLMKEELIEKRADILRSEGDFQLKADKLERNKSTGESKELEETYDKIYALRDKRYALEQEYNGLDAKHEEAMMADLAKFTKSRSGSHVSANFTNNIDKKAGRTSKWKKPFEKNAKETEEWFSKHVSSDFQNELDDVRMFLAKSSSGSNFNNAHYSGNLHSVHFGTRGNAEFNTSKKVIAHELGHAMSGRLPKHEAAITRFHDEKVAAYLKENPNAKEVAFGSGSTYYRGHRDSSGKSVYGYYSEYAGFDHSAYRKTTRGIEIPSTGMEAMIRHPLIFRKENREHFEMTAFYMAGVLGRDD